MDKLIWSIMDIVVTLVIIGLGLPVMAEVTVRTMDASYHEFDSVQEKTLLQTNAELYDDDPSTTYFTKWEVAGIYIVQQAKDGVLAYPQVWVEWGGATAGPFQNGAPTWEEQTVDTAVTIMSNGVWASIPNGRVLRVRDHISPTGQKDGVIFYG